MTRKRKPCISARKRPYKLEGGPMHGHTLWLSYGGTLTFQEEIQRAAGW